MYTERERGVYDMEGETRVILLLYVDVYRDVCIEMEK